MPQAENFPQPDAHAASVSQALLRHLKHKIQASKGAIAFDDYMQSVLYEPGLGYYCNGTHKFGSAGDFVTAPEISSLFGRCLARSVATVLATLVQGDLCELGAGSGVLAVDVLRELQALDQLPEHYYILDLSADLKARQRQRFEAQIPDLLSRVVWLDSLPSAPFKGVIFANEVADALPVKRFRWENSRITELGVSFDNGRLNMTTLPLTDSDLADHLSGAANLYDWPEGFESEYSPALAAWIHSLSDCIDQGALLLIDYGCGRAEYYHTQRSRGTLMCHYQHRAHPDPFLFPGLQDITAYVDFTNLADSAIASGLVFSGYCTQAHYLLDNGVEHMLSEIDASDQLNFLKRVSELKTLTMPGEMGERFKAIAFVKNIAANPGGFGLQDLRSRL